MRRLTELEKQQVNDNLNLIHHLLKRYTLSKEDYEDCFQVGCFGLCLAVQRFDKNYGTEFSTFASAYINGYMKRYIRECCKGPIKPPRSSYHENDLPCYLYVDGLKVDEDKERSGYDFIELQESKEDEILLELELYNLKYKLSDRENKLLNLLVQNKTQMEITGELKVKQPQVSRLVKSLRTKVKSYI